MYIVFIETDEEKRTKAMCKYLSKITRDIVLAVKIDEKTISRPILGGTISIHRSKKSRDAYIAAINFFHPGAAEAILPEGKG